MQFKENETLIVLRFGELWLKGRNRNDYIRRLVKNIKEQLAGEHFTLERHFDRLIIRTNKKSDNDAILSKLKNVFGISRVEVAVTAKPTLAGISAAAKKMLSSRKEIKSIRINSHRSYKLLPFNSVDVVKRLREIAEKLGIDPTTKGYQAELNVSVTKDAAFISIDGQRGAGGLPVGTSGKAVILLSGGIDSPVAAWYAMKRGLEPVYIHLHAFQDSKQALDGKVTELFAILSSFYPHYRAYIMPSHLFQASSFKFGKYELVLLKAFMLRVAERVATKEGAKVIFTGESLGQVASQTPENLSAEQYGIKLPVLRPLIGYDKEEIIKVAKAIGTFDVSIRPYRDVCSIKSRNQKLNSKEEKVEELLGKMQIKSIVTRSLNASKLITA